MRTGHKLFLRLIGQGTLAILLTSIFFSLSAQAEVPVRVLVYGEHVGKNIVYHYTFINNSTETLYNFTIGSIYGTEAYGPEDTYDFPQLRKIPIGWKVGKRGEVGKEIILDPTSTTQPYGWVPWAYGQEGIGYFYLEWRTKRSDFPGVKGIAPGETLAGFSATVTAGIDRGVIFGRPRPEQFNDMYVDGGFRVDYWDDKIKGLAKIRGKIEKQDTTPPVLTVTATPNVLWPPNNKPVPVTVTVSATDDHDRQPLVKLESITANESIGPEDIADAKIGWDDFSFGLKATRAGTSPPGRIYTITYSATDGTGNKTLALTTVTVPHDQGKSP